MNLPTDPRELDPWLDDYTNLKKRLVHFATTHYKKEYQSTLEWDDEEVDVISAVDDFVFTFRFEDGSSPVERFVRSSPKLSRQEQEIVLGWDDSILGLFRLERREGSVLHATNLIDDLPYRLLATQNASAFDRAAREHACLFSRVLPFYDAWALSGQQSVFPTGDGKLVYGIAAQLVQRNPNFFFRNPANLEAAYKHQEKLHARFLQRFGASWFVGSPAQILEAWRDFSLEKADEQLKARAREAFRLPEALQACKQVGLICCPQQGTYFLEEFDRLLTALEDPDRLDDPDIQKVAKGYLCAKNGPAPAIFDLFARECPEKHNALMARLLSRPRVDWAQDRENILQQYNPSYLHTPSLPSTLMLPAPMVEGLKYLEGQSLMAGDRSRRLKTSGSRNTGLSHAGAGRSAFSGATPLPLSDDERRKQRNRMKRKRKASKR